MAKRVVDVKDGKGNLIGYAVRCPACEADDKGSMHLFSLKMGGGAPGWSFNGDYENPTFSPSMRASAPYGPEKKQHVCHSFVREGRIQYLGDCTHAMAGQTIELPPWDDKDE